MVNSNQPSLRPVNEWFSNGYNDDVLLHSPTTGLFFGDKRQGEGEHPPSYFAADPAYASGYKFWEQRGSEEARSRLGELVVGVFLADPNDPEGLGHPEGFESLVEMSDAVGYAFGRGVNARLSDNPRIARVPGLVVPEPVFEARLNDVLYGFDTFSFDVPASEPVTGAIERGLFELAEQQGDPADPTLALMAADMVYCNTVQWGMAGLAGAHMAPQPNRSKKVLLVAAPEHADLARKISRLGDVTVETVLATDEVAENPDNELYATSLKAGIIPVRRFFG